MAKCPNCGIEIENGAKFCMECGTAIPQTKECPACHAHWPLTAKFCAECGYNFNSTSLGGGSVIGDKNVIAGDVHIDQSSTVNNNTVNNITNTTNTTVNNVTNVDESKRMVLCHVCGRNVTIRESFKCIDCGEIVCADCYDKVSGVCKLCSSKKSKALEEKYRITYEEMVRNGRIEFSDRQKLDELKVALALPDSRVLAIEDEVNRLSRRNADDELSAFEKFSLSQARKAYFDDCDGKQAESLLQPLLVTHPNNEEIVSLYVESVVSYDENAAIAVIENLKVDLVRVAMTDIDIKLAHGDMNTAERLLVRAESLWPESVLVKIKRALFVATMAKAIGDRELVVQALKILPSSEQVITAEERSWRFVAESLISIVRGDRVDDVTATYCKENGLYFAIAKRVNDYLSSPCDETKYEVVQKWNDASEDDYVKITKDEFDEIYRLASIGEVKAQLVLAALYFHGCAVSGADLKQFFNWVQKAAEQGDLQAMQALASCYCFGDGVQKDEKKAFDWMLKAAKGGYATAQKELGSYYRDGIGVSVDHVRESEWYLTAADAGNADAQNNIAWNYVEGRGVEKSYANAVKYFELGARQGNVDAMSGLAYMRFRPFDGSAPDYEDAGYWYEKSAEKGHQASQKMLSSMYFKGIGVCYDEQKATYWMELAIENARRAGANTDTVEALEKDFRFMKLEFEKANKASVEELLALFNLGDISEVDLSYPKFHKLLKAANHGSYDAAYAVGLCYKLGLPNKDNVNLAEAVKWLALAVQHGVVGAYDVYGRMFVDGVGVAQDPVRAIQIFMEGAQRGNKVCCELMAKISKS